jgi:hypothetical protein
MRELLKGMRWQSEEQMARIPRVPHVGVNILINAVSEHGLDMGHHDLENRFTISNCIS